MSARLSEYHVFFTKMHILWKYFNTDAPRATSFESLFLIFDLLWEKELTAAQLGFLALIHGDAVVDIMNKWVEAGIVEANSEGQAQTFHLTVFPAGHEELVELLDRDDQTPSMYSKLLADTKAAMSGSPSMEEVVRKAIANWKWLQSQELELGQDSAVQNESALNDEN
jgi:hypothetical protein